MLPVVNSELLDNMHTARPRPELTLNRVNEMEVDSCAWIADTSNQLIVSHGNHQFGELEQLGRDATRGEQIGGDVEV